jgi:hypothetical protein
MTSLKFNENKDCYPKILISDELSSFLENNINYYELFPFLNIKLKKLDLNIKTEVSRVFYNTSFDSTKKYDNSSEIENFIEKFPNYKVYKNDYNKSTYTAEYYVNENIYFSSKDNYGNYFIQGIKLPKKPVNYYEVTTESKDWGCLFSLFFLLIFTLFLVYLINFNAFIFLLITVIFSLFIYIPTIKNSISSVEKIKKSTIEYDKELEDFKQEIEKIRTEIKVEFSNEFSAAKKTAIENIREIVPKLISEKLKPKVLTIKKMNNELRGKSELFFLTKLYETFNSQILVDVIPNIGKNPFQPDFVLICNETGHHIDIEIDEPYAVNMGKPIHHDRCNDDDRNEFFLDINWSVIRFSEKQIIENSAECIELIKNFLNAIKKKKNIIEHFVPLHKKWSYEEALIMSESGYRNTYLPHSMRISINYNKNINSFESDDLPF